MVRQHPITSACAGTFRSCFGKPLDVARELSGHVEEPGIGQLINEFPGPSGWVHLFHKEAGQADQPNHHDHRSGVTAGYDPYSPLYGCRPGLRLGVRGVWQRHRKAEWDAARIAESQAHAEALQSAAREIAKLETSAQVIKERVIRETVDRPVYRDCAHSDSVLNDINAAITGQSVDPGELPASGPSD